MNMCLVWRPGLVGLECGGCAPAGLRVCRRLNGPRRLRMTRVYAICRPKLAVPGGAFRGPGQKADVRGERSIR
jgi:hypothetical protein